MKVRYLVAPVAALALAGCSSSGSATVETPSGAASTPSSAAAQSSTETETPSSAATQSSTESPSTTESSSATTSQSSTGSASGFDNALLTASELGTGYTGGTRSSSGGSTMPCTPSKGSLDSQVSPDKDANASFRNSTYNLQMTESVKEYGSEATAIRAYNAAVAGFNCSSGKLSGTTVKIVTKSATPGSGTDALKAWDFGDGKTVKGTVVTGRVGNRFVGLTFLVPATQDASSINLSTIVSKALTKAKQA